jgi:hypothetical protein
MRRYETIALLLIILMAAAGCNTVGNASQPAAADMSNHGGGGY